MKKGKFIVIDGIDGSGKSTQVRMLKKKLGTGLVFTHDPGGTPTSEAVRAVLLGGTRLSPLAVFFLFLASRAALVEEVIAPALARGKNVISDRFDSSTYAYQVYAEKRPLLGTLLRSFVKGVLKDAMPDAYIILDGNPERAKKRLALKNPSELNAYDKKPLAHVRRVRDGFRKFKRAGSKVFIVNADRTPDEVFKDVFAIVSRTLN
ncbi:dTMP kinase [Candidatus Kaiserbacteria bacterium]|nr:dTMP kinase [Candidatus Kaiserbacteria bacterium]